MFWYFCWLYNLGIRKMNIFEKFNKKSKCHICGTNEDKPCTLIAIYGTQKGNLCEGAVVHIDCLKLTLDKEAKIIYQRIENSKEKR